MRLVVIDGQGGGVGKSLVAAVKRLAPEQTVIAVGTNAQATAAMLRAGADMGATGENAIRYQCGRADVIAGVTGLLNANAMLGEISPAIAASVSLSEAKKVLVPLERCGAQLPWAVPLPVQALACTAAITACELAAGLVLNVWLDIGVWDYSHMWGNLWGQICPQYAALWFALSLVMIPAFDWMRWAVEGGEKPHYR